MNYEEKKMHNKPHTEEIFRVTYEISDGFDGETHRLMKQTYPNKPPFYFRVKGTDRTDVETASSNIEDIIEYFERAYNIDFKWINKIHDPKIKKIYEYCASKTKEFLEKLKKYAEEGKK